MTSPPVPLSVYSAAPVIELVPERMFRHAIHSVMSSSGRSQPQTTACGSLASHVVLVGPKLAS